MNKADMRLVITPGDPRGIGAEVVVAALRSSGDTHALLVGDTAAVLAEATRQGLAIEQVEEPSARVGGARVQVCAPPAGSGPMEARALRLAVGLCRSGWAHALVTGPIHKQRMVQRGFGFTGHTDFLAALCGVRSPVMAFVGERLRCALVTTHLPLAAVPTAITEEGILHVVRTTARALRRDLGMEQPRIAVCGLNPHAGDGGVLGQEDGRIIAPACERAVAEGWHVEGPVSVETAVRWNLTGRVDLFIAMYHDQGLAPLKAVDFGHSVNWTLGLPIIRTSVDHGTADDLLGQGVADFGSMVAAIALAEEIARQRQRGR